MMIQYSIFNIQYSKENGFTLLEVLLSIAVLGAILGMSIYYLGGTKTATEINTTANQIVGKLREAQSKAMVGEDNSSWGIHFDNADANDPYFEIFSGTSYPGTIVEKIYLNSIVPDVRFQTPTSGASVNVVFSKITGTPSFAQNIVIYLVSFPDMTKTITVETSGRISVQ